jgi:hypothetical protein
MEAVYDICINIVSTILLELQGLPDEILNGVKKALSSWFKINHSFQR